MPEAHPLDRPVWCALNTGWSLLAQGNAQAMRLDPDYGPFAAAAEGQEAALAALIPEGGMIYTVEPVEKPAPAGTTILKRAQIVQMIVDRVEAVADDYEQLTEDDAPEMLALALLTEPGPFARHTNRLAQFIGIRRDDRLAAMAGERMRAEGFAELSGVCTHPEFRGHGFARLLSSAVTARIFERGETPFLHAWATNTATIALYERLGYRIRRELTATALAKI